MSQQTRETLADAANALDGVNVAPYWRQTTKSGDGWIRLDTVTYPNRFGGLVSWQVLVVLPSDLKSAEVWMDNNLNDLVAALQAELTITSAQPQLLIDNKLPVLAITGTRETE